MFMIRNKAGNKLRKVSSPQVNQAFAKVIKKDHTECASNESGYECLQKVQSQFKS